MFFLFILVIFTILIIAIHTSKIGIDIKNLIIDTDAEEKINEDGKIYVYLLLFNKIKLFRKNVRFGLKDNKIGNQIRIKFKKHGTMKFIGHLDVMRYFQKAIRRADGRKNGGNYATYSLRKM